ncbi:APC family permease [Peribacillus butanolivorans]|uniref:Amino acid permease n=1 Tax=Peribacillus butanolivorans TaxID=421767 RepID=A0ABN5MZ96_9BACI|nr:amino acid permease [Peribacillus butanolivorans]AXN38561.1 amino acid permease [Peribacillus butanolivorans]KRF67101.1 serine/threonine protein kinase [Bacillus sp. Soil768D1]QNU02956.1 amino acid permease [Peribacillus butanolivorans]
MGNDQLKKTIGFWVGTSIVVGTVIGSGIFMKPGDVLELSGNSTMALLAWLIGGLITLASGLTIAEVSTRIPKTGGLYVYLEEVYGKVWGFLCGWVQTLVYGPAVMGALSLYFGLLVVGLFNISTDYTLFIGILTIVFLAGMNLLGTKYGGMIQALSTVGKLIPIIFIAVFGIAQGEMPVFDIDSESSMKISMAGAILATLWAYDGWMNVGFMAGEMKNPQKNLPRAIITGILVVMVAYLAVNLAMLHVLGAEGIIANGTNAANVAATLLFGELGGKLIAIGILVSIFGCLNGKLLTFPRITLAMADNKMMPGHKQISKISPKFKTPINATILQVVIAIIMMVVTNPDKLTNMAIFSVFSFYGLAFFAVFILRKKDPDAKTYKVPFYPLVPIIAIAGAVYIVVSTLIDTPLDALYSVIIVIVGMPVYWLLTKNERNEKQSN